MKHKHKLKRYYPMGGTEYFLWYTCEDETCLRSGSPILFNKRDVYRVITGQEPTFPLTLGL